jgi:hypothetical protein
MTMLSAPASYRGLATRIGLTLGGGGLGSLATLAFVHRPSMTAVAAAAAIVALAANAIESAGKALPEIISAISSLIIGCTRARADAKATLIRAKVRAEIARAGMEPGKSVPAAEMMRQLSIDTDLPEDRRPSDETLTKLLAPSRARNTSRKSGSGPETPGSGSRRPRANSDKVIPIRPDG